MTSDSRDAASTKRGRRRLHLALGAPLVAALAVAPAALGLATTVTTPAAPPATTAQPPAPTAAAARVLLAPSVLADGELRALALELELATSGDAIVVLRVPVSARLAESVDAAVLERLASASKPARLALLMEPGDPRPNGAAAMLAPFADASYVRANVTPPTVPESDARWKRVVAASGCAATCRKQPARFTSATQILHGLGADGTQPRPLRASLRGGTFERALSRERAKGGRGGGGGFPTAVVLALVALAAAAAAAFAFARSRRRARNPPPVTEPPERDPPPPPPRSGHGRPARVHSALHPDGYVELDDRLLRARWGGPGAGPATRGELVEVEEQGGRLWAFPSGRTQAQVRS